MWQNYDHQPLSLCAGIVHLWRVFLPSEMNSENGSGNILSVDEMARANRFLKEQDKIRYVYSKMILRQILARYLDFLPEKIQFSYGKKGKPFVVSSELQFNVSHSGDYLLIGVTFQNPIGVDIEYQKPHVNFLGLAERFFSQSEFEAIKSYPSSEQAIAFYRCWTRKEAFIKAVGLGLFFPLSDFDVEVSKITSQQSCLLNVRNSELLAADWSLQSVTLDDWESSCWASFAIRGSVNKIFYWNCSSFLKKTPLSIDISL